MPLIVALVVLLVAALFLGILVVIAVEHMALAFLWVAPVDPVVGWLLVGVMLGGLAGLAVGFRRGGRPLGALGVLGPVALCALLLLAGARYPRPEQSGTGPSLLRLQVTAEELNVRSAPDRTGGIMGRLSRGAVVAVDQNVGEWYRVADGEPYAGGWVNGGYATPLPGQAGMETPSPVRVDTSMAVPVDTAPTVSSAPVDSAPFVAPSPPPVPPTPELRGRWRGRFDGNAARLHVNWQEGERFSGILESEAEPGPVSHGQYRVEFRGTVAPGGEIVFTETAVLSTPKGRKWTLGENRGRLLGSGALLNGSGSAGADSYEWFFERY